MAFSEEHFSRIRPFLFHLTNRNNIGGIRNLGKLHSAAVLIEKAGDSTYLRQKRIESIEFQIGKVMVSLSDQQPLYAGNVRLEGGWSFEEFVESLNQRIYFWPGKQNGPIPYGHRHFQRYVNEGPVIVRISTGELYRANPGVSPHYCRFNSGSPRCSNGIPSPRGPNTFIGSAEANYAPSKVIEVTYLTTVNLPSLVEVADSIFGPWRKL